MTTNKKTEILGAVQFDHVFARHCNGKQYRYEPGMRVGVTVYIMSPEGGMLQGYRYTTIKTVGYGTEENMLGDRTPLVVVEIDGTERTMAARLVDVYEDARRGA